MNWKNKALIMNILSKLPLGEFLYITVQRLFGRLNSSPYSRIPHIIKMLSWLKAQGDLVNDKILFEVGTGHIPLLPIGFFLAGAKKVYTYDLNKRLQLNMLTETLEHLIQTKEQIKTLFLDFVTEPIFEERFNIIIEYHKKPEEFLKRANIIYVAPGDAAESKMEDKSIDLHFSCTTFEHIPFQILNNIMIECIRILKDSGKSIHFIDPSDHFQHQDKTITKINFLKYSQEEWAKIGENQFAYCNRLRYLEYKKIFTNLGFRILKEDKSLCLESIESIKHGFQIHKDFESYSIEDLCVTSYDVLLQK